MSPHPVGGAERDLCRQQSSALILAVLPDAPEQAVNDLVAQVTPTRVIARSLRDHLREHPDALTSGASKTPRAVLHLARLLADGPAPGVVRPGCLHCGQKEELVHLVPDGRLCRRCYRLGRTDSCVNCGRVRPVHSRDETGGAWCTSCNRSGGGAMVACLQCGRIRKTTPSDTAMEEEACGRCSGPTTRRCTDCGTVFRAWPVPKDPDRCAPCRGQAHQRCVVCGQRWTSSQDAVCYQCAPSHQRFCQSCQASQGPRPPHACPHCRIIRRLQSALANEQGHIAEQVEPLIAFCAATDRPESLLDWLTRRKGGRLLRDLARNADQEPITHDLLDQQEPGRHVHHLRALLVHCDVLPERTETLERLHRWLEGFLDALPTEQARLVRPFAHWHILRRVRQRPRSRPFSKNGASWAATQIRVATEFLTWLDEQATTLGQCGQQTLDLWLAGRGQRHYAVAAFIDWARSRRLVQQLTVPTHQANRPYRQLDPEQRWRLLQTCLTDDSIPTDVRAAGALLALYGHFVARLTPLTSHDLQNRQGDDYLTIAGTALLIPPAVAEVIRTQLAHRPPHTAAAEGAQRTWLFPGRNTGRPVTTDALTRRLRRHGIDPRLVRNTAMAAWAGQLPEAVVAQLFNIHLSTAVTWAKHTGRDWTDYLAARAQHPIEQDQAHEHSATTQ
ncbi:hypothetical protein [Kitasatospora kifunensis]|uniref:Uncharacterized protein n=1 Tax=Kitasatospora kifunensis TaxID=58351 RepID=A0A7W7VZM6_KITKI|nr:hypothetical protein [Kitasatospora kifunensis]MBB4928258.1 hypothetical protein [Kitasatospora kifunensis]